MERAGSALGPLIKDLGLEEALRLYRIKQSWKESVGEPLAMHAAPVALKGGVLSVNVSSPAWLQQAGYYKAEIIGRLGPLGVTGLRLKLGKVQPPSPKRAAKKPVRVEPDPAILEEMLSSIADDDVKETVRRALRKALSTPKKKSLP